MCPYELLRKQAAEKMGMTYLQIPFGYDGLPNATGQELVKAIRAAKKPVYIHCHAGKHRSSTAVAFYRVYGLGWAARDAKLDMRYMLCNPNYPELYGSNDRAQKLRKGERSSK